MAKVPEGMEPAPDSVTVSAADFRSLLQGIASIGEALKNQSQGNIAKDLSSMVEGMAKIAENSDRGPIKSIPVARTKQRTPWNPTGDKKLRGKFVVNTFLNGFRLNERMHSKEEVDLLNQLKHGRYTAMGEGKTIIVVMKDGPESRQEKQIWVPNKTQSDRIALARFCAHADPTKSGLVSLCEKLLAEAAQIKLANA